MESGSDHELIRRVQSGDRDAMETLFVRYRRQVHALCYRMTGDATLADDLTQESFLRVLRYGKSFDGRSKFTTWLYRLVRNRCLDYLTAQRRDERNLTMFANDHSIAPQRRDPHDERGDLLREALGRLSPEKREVLVLSRFAGLRYKEIAEVCEISVENVKVRAHRAMRELRRICQELEQEA